MIANRSTISSRAFLCLLLAAYLPAIGLAADLPKTLIFDMVHHNPGEPLTVSQYEDPKVIKAMGYNGKVYFLFDSPSLAVNWESVDPDIFPKGSTGREWVEQKAARIDAQEAACKEQGILALAMADMILFPKTLIEKNGMESTFGDPANPQTEKLLREMIRQVFDRFPNCGGLVVRIGETYLQDAPFHKGKIQNKGSAEKTIIPLLQILRDEVCIKHDKLLVFRTWLSCDKDLATYLKVGEAIGPHPKLVFSVKHCEDDFNRGSPFSKIIGEGRHRQLIEVQCAREYEGKGAYPNYIANGVIDGFEEHRLNPTPSKFHSIGEFARQSPLFAGIWTWARGGGWGGPYLKNELWCDLNAWVIAQWANDPQQSEESVFRRYATERLGLKGDDISKFRRLCLLSAEAVLRGKTTTMSDISPWWSRDDRIIRPTLPTDPAKRQRVLSEKAEAVNIWEEIATLVHEIQFPDSKTKDFAIVSCNYGLDLYRIYQAIFELEALGTNGDKAEIRKWLAAYDSAWTDYRKLPAESPQGASLYLDKKGKTKGDAIDTVIAGYRKLVLDNSANHSNQVSH